MTPQQKADYLQHKYGDQFFRLYAEAKKLPYLPRNFNYRAKRILDIIDEMSSLVQGMATCKSGCAHCCYQSTVISSWEADRIASFAKRKIADIEGYDPSKDSRQGLTERFQGIVCPFLSENKCSIYQVRPSMCRLHFSLAHDPAPCDIRNNPGAKVPYFNLEPMKMLVSLLFMSGNCKFGDIREFFGE
jgi:uncharacterized protein